MAESANKATFFRWAIVNFQNQRLEAKIKRRDLISDNFKLASCPTISLALFFQNHRGRYWEDCTYGVASRILPVEKQIKFDLKLWLENDKGEKFCECSVQKLIFRKANDRREFILKASSHDWNLFKDVDEKSKTLFVCCELIDLSLCKSLLVDCNKDFLQNQWSLYEQGIHDAVVKVEDKKFKVLKSFFMAQSQVFTCMFNNSKFEEGSKNEVKVTDIEQATMEALVKWLYTNRLEKDSPIEKLFIAADKYDIKLLKSICAQRLISLLDDQNAFSLLILAVQYNDKVLRKAVLNFVVNLKLEYHVQFFRSTEWKSLNGTNEPVANEVGNLLKQKLKKK